jgi:DNA-binding beta-propeller fold protein YncE
VAAFPLVANASGARLGFSTGPYGGALALASGSHLGAPGASAPASLPAGGSAAFSASAWVKCTAPTAWAAVLEWGAAGDASAGASPQALALVAGGSSPLADSGSVVTFAGQIAAGYADGAGTSALFYGPQLLAVVPSSGALAVVDGANGAVRLVSPAGIVSTLAAAGSFSVWVRGVAVDPSSEALVVADTYNNRICLVSNPGGVVSTIAGSGVPRFADGAGVAASFFNPWGVVVVPQTGAIAVADTVNLRIRLVSPAGLVSTLAGSGVAMHADGAGSAASFSGPAGIAFMPTTGALVVADSGFIRLVTPAGVVTTLFSGLAGPGIAVVPSTGALIVANGVSIYHLTLTGVFTRIAGGV